VLACVVDRFLDDVEQHALGVRVEQSLDIGRALDQHGGIIGVAHFLGKLFQRGQQAPAFEHERAQREEHVANLFGRASRQVFDAPEFFQGLLRLLLHQAANIVDAHGDGCDRLRGTVVQVARELLAGVFLHLHNALFLAQQVLVQHGILQRQRGLCADGCHQFDVLIGEGVGLIRAEDHHPVHVESCAQRNRQDRFGVLEGDEVAQFWVAVSLAGEDRPAALKRQAEHTLSPRHGNRFVGARQAARGDHPQQVVFTLEEQHSADQAHVRP